MTNYKEYIKKRYNKDYDKSFKDSEAIFYYIALRNLSLENILKKLHCAKILDIGTGTGLTSLYLAEKGFKITGLDLTERMLSEALKKRKNKGLNYPLFVLADAAEVPFKKESFDAVFSTQLFQLFNNNLRKVFLKEIHRVTMNNGIVAIQFFNALSWIFPGILNYIRYFFGSRPYRYVFPWQAVSLFKENFEILAVRGESLPFMYLIARKNYKLAVFLNNLCSVFPFNYICSTFLIVARKNKCFIT